MTLPRLLGVLDETTQRQLLQRSTRRRFKRGEVVFHQGDPGDSLHMVVKGSFDVRVAVPSGRSVVLRIIDAGDHFGELALVQPECRRTATIAALEPSETMTLRRDDFDEVRIRHRGVDRLLVSALADRVVEASAFVSESLYIAVDKRVFRRLVLLDRHRQALGRSDAIQMTQTDLADMVGATRPTVNRILQRAVEAGAVELFRSSLVVHDRALLERWGR